MNLNFIKLFTLTTLFICCSIATYTDIKWKIIPNYLTFPMIIIGITTITYYFYITGNFQIEYYIAIVCIFIFSYILWYFGLWAGGDVKLITAITTLLIPSFLNNFTCGSGIISYLLPTFYVIVNSLLSTFPILCIIVAYEIIKNKPYLIGKLKKSFNIYETVFNLNILFILNMILSMLHIDVIIKYILICIILYIVNKKIPKKHTGIMTITTLITILIITPQLLKSYIITFIILEFIITFIYIMKHNLLDVILTKNYTINNLSEGMLLAQPLINTQHKYTFNNTHESGNIVLKTNIYGLEEKDITLLKKLEDENYITHVPIKKTICFAPFIQAGVILTILFGNIITTIIGVIL